jgi:perosamine synthetase
MDELKRSGIGTSVHFIPLHLHPFYQKRFGYRAGNFPNAEDAYSRSISLPLFPDMTERDVERVLKNIEKIICAHRKRILAPAA